MSSISYSTALSSMIYNPAASGGKTLADAMAGFSVDIYQGTRPINADAAVPSGNILLGTVTNGGLPVTPGSLTNGLNLGLVVNGASGLAAGLNAQVTYIAAGQPQWFRMRANQADNNLASTTLARIDGSMATFGGDATIPATSSNVTIGQINNISSISFPVIAGQ